MNKAIKIEKKFEFFLGLFFLIPPILGVCFFVIELFAFLEMDNVSIEGIVTMDYLAGDWTVFREYATPPAPFYLGLMAIAGAYLIKNSFRYFFSDNDKEQKVEEPMS